ncbi:MAG: hypothetical protein H7326_03715 [Bdellovibrionaceae bacterium]|nr:hypothetical protein [Pseudobdellovibrionaceae bacterium]
MKAVASIIASYSALVISLILPLTVVSSASADVGFSSGNQFTAIAVHGAVAVTCSDGVSVQYSCRDKVLEPGNFAYFVGPAGVVADSIQLASVRADRSRRERGANYDSSLGRSTEVFNLWISNLFQKPLLLSGANKVQYILINDGKPVSEGTVVVNVAQGILRECPAANYQSTDPQDCQSQYTVCQRYFEQFQNCR